VTNPVDQWLQQAARTRGILACGVRLSDQSLRVRVCREDISKARVEEAMKRIAATVGTMQTAQGTAELLRWVFESGDIVCALRPGGAMAVLLVNRDLAAADKIKALMQTFAETTL